MRSQEYQGVLKQFAAQGAKLISEDPIKRYRGAISAARRPLEPGFIPIDGAPLVAVVSYYPNDSDLEGDVDYTALREHFSAWGASGSLDDYAVAYEDWVRSLPLIPFYRDRMLPVTQRVGIGPREIAWLPLVKVPLPKDSNPGEELIWIDRDVLWDQLRALRPPIVWIQGVKTYETISEQAKRLTDRVLQQKLTPLRYQSREKAAAEIDAVANTLGRFVLEVRNSPDVQS